MKKAVKKEVVKKVEYFTDDMHKNIFPFQEGYKGTKSSGKPVMKSISVGTRKK
jgi:hypothetical protein